MTLVSRHKNSTINAAKDAAAIAAMVRRTPCEINCAKRNLFWRGGRGANRPDVPLHRAQRQLGVAGQSGPDLLGG
jgi:hypothetical protein